MKRYKLFTVGVSWFLLSALLGLIVWASIESNVLVGFNQVLSSRWGLATVFDIYIALTFIGIWIGVVESSVLKGMIWTFILYLLGNIATLVYILIRTRKSSSFNGIFIPELGRKNSSR